MKINSVKISNILSFGFKIDFDNAPIDISFDAYNGSGTLICMDNKKISPIYSSNIFR